MATNPRYTIRQTINGRKPVEGDSVITRDFSAYFKNDYSSNVFSDYEIERRVPKHIFEKLKKARQEGTEIDPVTADVVAQAMKVWAVEEHGATHYTHWFQPIRATTAEKHDSFINFKGSHFRIEFSGSDLLRGEPDASSFPNGQLRATHSARGYTSWDASSPAFVYSTQNGTTLYIPTKYISWTGEALDIKTPLLRSNIALSRQAVRLLRLLGDKKTAHVHSTLGAEQEFFVIDSLFYQSRPDLLQTGRTVIGALPPKAQQLEDHYFATIPSRILSFIQELEHTLWKLGVPVKTRHNEVAPGQHEMAPIFEEANIAVDHNVLQMALLQSVAEKHGLTTLLHEKPFKGVNGSGKHNNWSMSTESGDNLLNPGKNPVQNTRFHVFLAACIKAVDDHADVLRISVAHAANDHRLGANEAPPAIMSIYLGEDLEYLVNYLIDDNPDKVLRDSASSILHLGVGISPCQRDTTDRNRTSPFAFTGNKFEFRAPGSSQNCGYTISIVNLILTDAIAKIADEIEAAYAKIDSKDEEAKLNAVNKIVRETLKKHKRVIFDGNGYSPEWVAEAAKRGLPNLSNTTKALKELDSKKNVELFSKYNVLSKEELKSRQLIYYEEYAKQVVLEARSLNNLINTFVLPAAYKHQKDLAQSIQAVKGVNADIDVTEQVAALKQLISLVNNTLKHNKELHKILEEDEHKESSDDGGYKDIVERAEFVSANIVSKMEIVREVADVLEELIDDEYWLLPKYSEILHLK
eukprot:TRINITY_DN630_c0_g1_i4.p1 TRINITY_DN630_c0_g1~~TRINITY_DN630_c0_g1_i4.p1  ORF type:complete len:760 (-),score=167.18 TRINITY_DN630_c0_g1_i4:13-2259(-)